MVARIVWVPIFHHSEFPNRGVVEGVRGFSAAERLDGLGNLYPPAVSRQLFDHLIGDRPAFDGEREVVPNDCPIVTLIGNLHRVTDIVVCICPHCTRITRGAVLQLEGHVGLFCCVDLRYCPLLHRRDRIHLSARVVHVQGVGHGPVVPRFFHVRGGVGTATLVVDIFRCGVAYYVCVDRVPIRQQVVAFLGLQLPNAVVVVDRSCSSASVVRNGQAGEGVLPPLASDLRRLCIAAVQVDYGYIIPIRTIGGPLEDKPGGPGHGSVCTRAGVVLVAPVIPDLLHRHLHSIQRVGADAGVVISVELSVVDQAVAWVFVVIALPFNGLYVPIVGYRRLNDPVFQEDITAVVLVGHHRGQAGVRAPPFIAFVDPPFQGSCVVIVPVKCFLDILTVTCKRPIVFSAVVHCHLQLEGHGQWEAQVVHGNGIVVLVHPTLLKPDRGLDAVGEGAEIRLFPRIILNLLGPNSVTLARGVDLVCIWVLVICGSNQLQLSFLGKRLRQRVGPGHAVGGVLLKLALRGNRNVPSAVVGFVFCNIQRVGAWIKDLFDFYRAAAARHTLGIRMSGEGEECFILVFLGPELELIPIVLPLLGGGEICVSLRRLRLFVQEGGLDLAFLRGDILAVSTPFGAVPAVSTCSGGLFVRIRLRDWFQTADGYFVFSLSIQHQYTCVYCILCRPGIVPHQLVFDLRDGVLILRAVGGVEIQILVKLQFQGNQAGCFSISLKRIVSLLHLLRGNYLSLTEHAVRHVLITVIIPHLPGQLEGNRGVRLGHFITTFVRRHRQIQVLLNLDAALGGVILVGEGEIGPGGLKDLLTLWDVVPLLKVYLLLDQVADQRAFFIIAGQFFSVLHLFAVCVQVNRFASHIIIPAERVIPPIQDFVAVAQAALNLRPRFRGDGQAGDGILGSLLLLARSRPVGRVLVHIERHLGQRVCIQPAAGQAGPVLHALDGGLVRNDIGEGAVCNQGVLGILDHAGALLGVKLADFI